VELDHVLIAVSDLAGAAREIAARYGLASIEGGRHPDWGTANRIVPLGETYLELIAVVDEAKAAESAVGRWVAGARPGLARPLGWAVRTRELDAQARRLGLTAGAGSRAAPGGELLRWRTHLAHSDTRCVDAPSRLPPPLLHWVQRSPLTATR
jgi:hypothetical protein